MPVLAPGAPRAAKQQYLPILATDDHCASQRHDTCFAILRSVVGRPSLSGVKMRPGTVSDQ